MMMSEDRLNDHQSVFLHAAHLERLLLEVDLARHAE